ncbi:hypothetical protein BU25DRAFT_427325 [Macroventuria anomochaeta]|uniref:Uncharacterized protein n=1 Tax=Macroventuria anomochaeta TaxID=301207 RepID=A0ACB6SIA9_9PLEO|nr:uncharacterized protein BU25DRAFT_427325 [Macroventuria anomochaeta]KAF2633911.1 hypothetical protein BU25DRAFT_427325 [Macroventuria anomochaeta]
MVSLWPWRAGEDAASFERTLSALTAKINKATAVNDKRRQTSRRARVMWTLYAGFAYILAALLLILVTGRQNWGIVEVSVIAGSPVVIYLVRYALTCYFDYRISNTDAYLRKLNKERDATINRLKEATKYNSTQQLLEKYGASPKQEVPQPSPNSKKQQTPQKPPQPQGPRTGIAPPPTANIQRPQNQSQNPVTPQRVPPVPISPQDRPQPPSPGAEFAPNAFAPVDSTKQYSSAPVTSFTQSRWYDRILDALLGEDETQPKNRLALICSECRLVNGQAPPGARTVEDIGKWRCGGCNAWNGKETPHEEVANLVQSWDAARKVKAKEMVRDAEEEDVGDEGEDDGEPVVQEMVDVDDTPPSKSTRSKTKGKGKK